MIFQRRIEKVIVLLLLSIILYWLSTTRQNTQIRHQQTNRILVVYIYAQTHNYSRANLQFFIQVAVKQNDFIRYFIIVQQSESNRIDLNSLPKLPSNGEYIQHKNECFDIGTFGWFLLSNYTNLNEYKYFIMLNSSCRGPYLVSSISNWYDPFIRLLNNSTKLVGSTINCQSGLHVQSYILVLDKQGIEILIEDKKCFSCHKNQVDAIYSGEIQASQILLKKNFSINSVMKKYEKVNFVNKQSKFCLNWNEEDPFNRGNGIFFDPFDLIFVKYKPDKIFEHLRLRLSVYDQWILFNSTK